MALTIEDVRPDPVLTAIAQQYGTGGGFATEMLLPSRMVGADSFKYMTWGLREFIQGAQYDSRRAPGDLATRVEPPGGTWATGHVHERSLVKELPAEIAANAPNRAIYEQGISRSLVNHIRIEIEREFYGLVTNTSTISNATPAVKWDAASAVVIEDNIDAAKEAFIKQCGFEANYIVLPPAVADVVKSDSSIRELQKYTVNLINQGNLPPQLFGLNVVVPGAIEDAANPGASASIQRVWNTDKAILMYVNGAAANDPSEMTAVTRFYSEASIGQQYLIEQWPDPARDRRVTNYQVMAFDDIVATATDCIYILNDVLT